MDQETSMPVKQILRIVEINSQPADVCFVFSFFFFQINATRASQKGGHRLIVDKSNRVGH